MGEEAPGLNPPAVPGFQRKGHRFWCEKCNRPVESYELETPIKEYREPLSATVSMRHTGEQIVRIYCHGESFAWSNWRGVL